MSELTGKSMEMEAYISTGETASSCRSWTSGIDAAEAVAVSTIASSALAGSAAFTARPLHFDDVCVFL